MVKNVLKHARAHEKEYLKQLFQLLSIPSISTLPEHKDDLLRAAEWLAGHMKEVGLENVQLLTDGGNPVVYGDWLHAKGKPTVLIYGHYDVQPPDPLDEWLSSPFRPEVRNDNVYARGASDNKGQFFAHLKTLDSYFETEGKLPVNVKVIIEGEEEVASRHFEEIIKKNKKLLRADLALVSDTGSPSPDKPAIIYGLRGLLYTEISVQTAKTDLHSGMYGGAVENPAHVLARIISRLHDESKKVTIPGFYEDVKALEKEEKKLFAQTRGEKEILETTGARRLISEKGYTPVEAKKIRPTLDVNGIWAGFTGEGEKTVIPARAHAKISMRLVPSQEPEKIAKSLEKYLQELAPDTASVSFRVLSSARPVVTARDNPFMKVLQEAGSEAFGAQPFFNRTGGSIPAVEVLSRVLGLDSLLFGFALDDDNVHAPNEKFSLQMFRRGIDTSILFLGKLRQL